MVYNFSKFATLGDFLSGMVTGVISPKNGQMRSDKSLITKRKMLKTMACFGWTSKMSKNTLVEFKFARLKKIFTTLSSHALAPNSVLAHSK